MSDRFSSAFDTHMKSEHKVNSIQEYLRQIVYGGNDGIVTTFAIVAGFAGVGADGAAEIGTVAVLLFGIANLLADGTAMGLGEFLSSRSEQDVYRATRAKELHEIKENPDFERAETLQILTAKGVSAPDAERFADILQRNPEVMADFMMQYEIGMSDPSDDNPMMNGLATFVSFLIFGSIPLLPYFIFDAGYATFLMSVGSTLAALVALGLLRWSVTTETVFRCVGETVLVGGICAIVAFAVGLAFR